MNQPDANSVWAKDRDHVLHPYTDFSTFAQEGSQVIDGAQGMFVTDTDGRKMLDGIAGLWCVNVGYGQQSLIGMLTRHRTHVEPTQKFYVLVADHEVHIALEK